MLSRNDLCEVMARIAFGYRAKNAPFFVARISEGVCADSPLGRSGGVGVVSGLAVTHPECRYCHPPLMISRLFLHWRN